MADPALRHDIAELVHRYCDAVTRQDLERWASCWAADGRWELRADRVATDAESRLAILLHAFGSLEAVVQNALHGSVRREGDAAASGRWYIVEHLRRASGEPAMLLARYDDRYVREDGGWRFAARTLVPHYQGPPDLTGRFFRG